MLNNPSADSTAVYNAALQELRNQRGSTSGVDLRKGIGAVDDAKSLITKELKDKIDLAKAYASAGQSVPSWLFEGLLPSQADTVRTYYDAQRRDIALEDAANNRAEQSNNRANTSLGNTLANYQYKPLTNLGTQLFTSAISNTMLPSIRTNTIKSFNERANGLITGLNPNNAEQYNAGLSTVKNTLDREIDANPYIGEAAKVELHKGLATIMKQAKVPVNVSPVSGNQPVNPRTSKDIINVTLGGNGRVSSNYGHRSDPITGKKTFHSGLDVAANKGTPIKAADGGKVIYAGVKGGYGNTVIIQHPDGTSTLYGHLDKINTTQGAYLNNGTMLGTVGSTGKSTGPHLHYERRDKNNQAFTPYL